jgi:mono/diheme cytochrome c family protein
MTRTGIKTIVIALLTTTLAAIHTIGMPAEDESGRKSLVRQGDREWGPYCGSCHNARPAGERSPAEWDVIMMHMRARANLPAQDARALLEYLKAR